MVVDSGLLNQSWVNDLLEQLSSAYACTIKSDVPETQRVMMLQQAVL